MCKITNMKLFKAFLLLLSCGLIYSEPASACASLTNIPIGTTDYQIKGYGSAGSCFVYVALFHETYTTPSTTGNQTSQTDSDWKVPFYPYVLETTLWFIPSYSQGTGIRCFASRWSNGFILYGGDLGDDDYGQDDYTLPELCYLPFY